jgi:energy-coupling factor transporter ATP-binding protein EcfA2
VSVVSLQNVSFRYAGAEQPALAGISLELRRGDVMALVGPAGSGTSTLLLVAGCYAPRLTGGDLTGDRVVVAVRPAIVFATPWTQLTGMCQTVFDEVAFGPASFGWPVDRVHAAVATALARMGIPRLGERNPAQLSGGELQRVIVASALAMEPDLLLLDDPGAELDPAAANALYDSLREIAAGGTAIMVATPDVLRAARAANRAVRLEQGRIARAGVPGDVLS